jgi:hypothetical protein
MWSLDTETTGVDTRHSAKPFFVTACDPGGNQLYWEWRVNPFTREPEVPPEDLAEIRSLVAGRASAEAEKHSAGDWMPGAESSSAGGRFPGAERISAGVPSVGAVSRRAGRSGEEGGGDRGEADQGRAPLVLQNAKFDVAALNALDPWFGENWPWGRTHDTLLAGHLLASAMPHDLTSMTLQYLGIDIEPHEREIQKACVKARSIARNRIVEKSDVDLFTGRAAKKQLWRIAKAGVPGMPSAKDKTWKFDMWLPRAVAEWMWDNSEAKKAWEDAGRPRRAAPRGVCSRKGWECRPPDVCGGDHPWYTALRDYALADSGATVALWAGRGHWHGMEKEIKRRGYWAVYLERLKAAEAAYRMETRGLTFNEGRLAELTGEYAAESAENGRRCRAIAASYGYDLKLPKGGVNGSLRTFMIDVLKLEPNAPSLAADVMGYYRDTLPPGGKPGLFITSLLAKRKRDTALTFMKSYRRFARKWVPAYPGATDPETGAGWYVLHPSLNPTGTVTLRWSSSNPNEQNISKKEDVCGLCEGKRPDVETCSKCKGTGWEFRSLRYCFGPAPGREWWSLDAKNLELRIPAYEAGEEEFIALFERPDDPPYYGSNHLLIAHIIHPAEFEACRDGAGEIDGRLFKKKYASTLYQRTKNGNFAVQYGAVDREDGLGTADRTYGVPGAQARIKARFSKLERLNRRCIKFAEEHGYVETIPDRSVDPRRGYPIMCTRTEYGKIRPTVPLNYRVQGTAMWWTHRATTRVQSKLDVWRGSGFDGHIVIQQHDELVLDFPRSKVHPKEVAEGGDRFRAMGSNLWRIRVIQRLMEQGGVDIGVPTPVGCEYHADNWAEGVTL